MRGAALLALGTSVLLVTAGCSGSDNNGNSSGSGGGDVSMTLWTNATTGPGQQFFQDTVKNFPSTTPGPRIAAYLSEKIILAPAVIPARRHVPVLPSHNQNESAAVLSS